VYGSSASTTRKRLGIVERSRRKIESVWRLIFVGQVACLRFILTVRRGEEINGYCAIQNTLNTITLLLPISFSFSLIVAVDQATVKL
jgi:hypothetical protein